MLEFKVWDHKQAGSGSSFSTTDSLSNTPGFSLQGSTLQPVILSEYTSIKVIVYSYIYLTAHANDAIRLEILHFKTKPIKSADRILHFMIKLTSSHSSIIKTQDIVNIW